MKTLFLDFDGVLHDKYAAEQPGINSFRNIMEDRDCFAYLPALAQLLDGHDVDIVVHSGWRLGNQYSHDEMLAFLGPLANRFKGTTPPPLKRYESILHYVESNSVTDYCILDDAQDEFPADVQGLIVCNPKLGVSDPNVRAQLKYWLFDSQTK